MATDFIGRAWYKQDPFQTPTSMSTLDHYASDHFWRTPSSLQTSSDSFPFPSQSQTQPQTRLDPPLRALELHLERTYLLGALHAQSQSTAQLAHKIPLLESKLQQADLRPLHRKLRKQLGWVKSRLLQARLQERTMASRLDQLLSEIRARESWMQIEQEQQRREEQQRDEIFGYQQRLCAGLQMRMSLDPEQPEFQPQGYFPWQAANAYRRIEEGSYFPSSVPVAGEDSPYQSPRCGYTVVQYNSHQPHLSRRSASMGNINGGVLASDTLLVPMSNLKRHSFPSLPGCPAIWTPTAKEQADAEVEANTGDAG